MCGIAIAIRPIGACPACTAPGMAIMLQAHRGPHGSGSVELHLPWADVSLVMSRLKIVDQRDLAIPFRSERLQVAIAYNGEIYNWRQLRADLSQQTETRWETECDTEVLAVAYRYWGIEKALRSFNGMFSFILVDMASGAIHMARDRLGQKPLFYAMEGDHFYAASEAKALPIHLERVPCLDAEVLEYDVLDSTPLRGVKRLLPGHRLELCNIEDGSHSLQFARSTSWYSLPEPNRISRPDGKTDRALTDELEELLLDSVKLRCDAQVPVALQFSGGLDSTLIHAACLQLGLADIPLFCVTMQEIDHLSVARAACSPATVYPVEIDRSSFLEALPKATYHLDTPATWTAVCLWLLDEAIAKTGARIVISGEGADELFCGYSRYRALYWLDQALRDPLLQDYQPLVKRALKEPLQAMVSLLDRGETDHSRAQAMAWLLQFGSPEPTSWLQLARTETHTTLQCLLRMADRMASAHSLENRCPFLDHRIVKLSTQLPEHLLINAEQSKVILRQIAHRWGVPDSVINETTKRGLAIPWAKWGQQVSRSGSRFAGGLSRGAWDRRSFSSLMHKTWHEVMLSEHLHCTRLPDKPCG